MDAYLDIETTGLSPWRDEITVVGLGIEQHGIVEVRQLYESDLSPLSLRAALKGVDRVFTYNGKRFDLPFLTAQLGVDLEEIAGHQDLMYSCWRVGLYGGLKAVERRLGIRRKLEGLSGVDAVELWHRYKRRHDRAALLRLLAYNREDVTNLSMLRKLIRQ